MKLLAPITVIIAAAAAGLVYDVKPQDTLANALESYQSAVEHQQRGQYSVQSEPHTKSQHIYREQSSGDKSAKILGFDFKNDVHNYKYGYETDNGIKAEEVGDTSGKGTRAQGAYSYKGDDGKVYTVTYIADENGFRPSGEHIPTPPPIPEAILQSLEQNAKDEANGIYDDGNYREHKQTEHHQYEGEQHQAEYGSSGADLAYHGQSPSYHTAAGLLQEVSGSHGGLNNQISSEHSQYSHQSSTGYSQPNVVYYMPSGNSGYYLSQGHNEGVSHQGHRANLHSGFYPISGYAAENSGHISTGYGESSGYVGKSYLPPTGLSGYH